jgi:hypothetical protein
VIKLAIIKKGNKKANAYARKYYEENENYRKKKIRDRSKYYASHKEEEAKNSREYYWSNPDYRKKKIAYARQYRISHNKKKSK